MTTGAFSGLRVIEIADEKGEFCGRILAGGGADVIKIEPPGGSPTRRIGPFRNDIPDPEGSLYFWQYNLGKRSLTLDLDTEEGRAVLGRLATQADVVLESLPPGTMAELGLGYEDLAALNPGIIVCSITSFGQSGPWRDLAADDLVHLALGGQMMVCGYDPEGDYDPANPAPAYDTPPIAPQMWHSAHVAGANAAVAITAALLWRETSGLGQHIDCSIHEALAACTEMAVPMWIYNHAPMYRQTGRHAFPVIAQPFQRPTADGKWMMAMGSVGFGDSWRRFVDLLERHGVVDDLADPKYEDVRYRSEPEAAAHVSDVTQVLLATTEAEELMAEAQAIGLPWAVVRRPEENVSDPHWQERGAFAEIEHPELGERHTYVAAPWVSADVPWTVGRRAPFVGEDTAAILSEL